MALDSPKGPLAISIIHDKESAEYKALVRTAQVNIYYIKQDD